MQKDNTKRLEKVFFFRKQAVSKWVNAYECKLIDLFILVYYVSI